MGCSVAPAGCETEVRQRRPYERIVVCQRPPAMCSASGEVRVSTGVERGGAFGVSVYGGGGLSRRRFGDVASGSSRRLRKREWPVLCLRRLSHVAVGAWPLHWPTVPADPPISQ